MPLFGHSNFTDRLMGDENWIKRHVDPCFKQHLSAKTFDEKIVPIIKVAIDNRTTDLELEQELVDFAHENFRNDDDIFQTIERINNKVIHEAESASLPTYRGFYVPVSCALFGRFIIISGKKIGTIR